MNQILKLNVMHKLIMGEVAGEAVIQAGIMRCGWKRDSSVQEVANTLRKQTAVFERQIAKTYEYMRAQKTELSKETIIMYKEDIKDLAQTIRESKVDQKLFVPIRNYVHCLEGFIL